MYAGKKVEEANVEELFASPCHPYTEGLMASIPRLDVVAQQTGRRTRLKEIKGMVPSLHNLPRGCLFEPRCPYATDQCRNEYPPLEEKRPGHVAACWHSDRLQGAHA
jgi:peptide/nickel transport system ATP-binding protein